MSPTFARNAQSFNRLLDCMAGVCGPLGSIPIRFPAVTFALEVMISSLFWLGDEAWAAIEPHRRLESQSQDPESVFHAGRRGKVISIASVPFPANSKCGDHAA